MRLHIDSLTGFRALAAGMVLIGHIVGEQQTGAPWFLRYGWTGVNLFFALSGFLFTLLYFDAFYLGAQSLREYFLKRIFRIYPLVITLVAITVLSRPMAYSIGNILSHITLTHAYFKSWRYAINPPMWTLTVEESFYLLVPVLFAALGKLGEIRFAKTIVGQIWAIAAGVAAIHFCSTGMMWMILDLKMVITGIWDSDYWVMTIFGRFSDFGFGIIAGLLALRLPRSIIFQNRWLSTGLFLTGIGIWLATAGWMESTGGTIAASQTSKLYTYFSRLYGLGGTMMILGLAGRSPFTAFFGSRPMIYLGKISFALYLCQFMPIGAMPNLALQIHLLAHEWLGSEWLAVTATYLTVSLVAAGLYHIVELPAQKWLRARFYI